MMRLTGIYINGFGIFQDFKIENISPGLTVLEGHNEAGKTTLMDFLHSVLFGMAKNQHEPLRGGRHGGTLTMEDCGGEKIVEKIVIERYAAKKRGALKVYGSDGEFSGQDVLSSLLGGISGTLYQNVFAFGLSELQRLETLQGEEVGGYIYGAGMGGHGVSLPEAERALIAGMQELYRPQGQKPEINRLFKELDQTRRDISNLQLDMERFNQLNEKLNLKDREITRAKEEAACLKTKAEQLKKLIEGRDIWERLAHVRQRMEELPLVVNFPAGGVERLAELDGQMRRLTASLSEQADIARVIEEKERALDQLGTCLARRGELSGQLEFLKTRLGEAEQRRESLRHRLSEYRGFPRWIYAAVLAAGALLVAVLLARNSSFGAAVSSIFTFTLFFLLRNLSKRDQNHRAGLDKEYQEADSAIRNLAEEEKLIREQLDELHRNMQRLSMQAVGKQSVSPGELQEVRRELERERGSLAGLEARIGKCADDRQRLLREGGAADAEEFMSRAQNHKQRLLYLAEQGRLDSSLKVLCGSPQVYEEMEEAWTQHSHAEIMKQWKDVSRRQQQLELQLQADLEARGKLVRQIEELQNSAELARTMMRKNMLQDELGGHVREWAVKAICHRLMVLARERYERERQPGVLKQASRLFSSVTEGRYQGILATPGKVGLVVETADQRRIDTGALSRGTAEQLYLCMRFALIDEFARKVGRLPVLMDDVLVNFDPRRLEATAKLLHEFVQEQQVLFFTCHPHIAELLRKNVPNAAYVKVRDGQVIECE